MTGLRRMDGLAVYDRPRPGAVRVVFVHGTMDRSASFVKTMRRLPDLDLVRYDRRGYGQSAGAGMAETIDEHVADLVSVIDGVPSVVVGHSFGALVALAAAAQRPDAVRALVAYESPVPWTAWWPARSAGGTAVTTSETEGMELAVDRFMRRMIGDERWDQLPPAIRAARHADGRLLIADLRAARRGGVPFDPSALTHPVMVGTGSESEPHHQHGARYLVDTLPDAELVVIDGATHTAHFTHPQAFAAIVTGAVVRAGERA
jgi:pimeloyl-ACP methyl ester carboxylesterase